MIILKTPEEMDKMARACRIVGEVLEDMMDIQNAGKVIEGIEDGNIKIIERNSSLPSPFAFNIVMQGKVDVMKIEDKVEFLRRMHNMVLAKIGSKLEKEDIKEFSYDEYFEKEEHSSIKE